MQQTAFILPGFRESGEAKGYLEIAKIFSEHGCNTQIISIQWNRRTMSDYIDEIRKAISGVSGEVYLLGFSFGAMIAAVIASEVKPQALFLCSLSPYFAEDLVRIPNSWKKAIGKRRMEDFATLSFKNIASDIFSRTFLFLGETEAKRYPAIARRSEEANRLIKNSQLIRIPKGKHDLHQDNYANIVKNIISQVIL